MAAVGNHIRRIRSAKHLTQEQLAEKLFVTRQAVSAWETGKAQPDVETLERIAAALDADVTELIYGPQASSMLEEALRHKWWQGLIWGILITRLVCILLNQGYWHSWTEGLSYHFANPYYQIYMASLPEAYTLELDFTDPYSNEGKVLYEDDEGCKITVSSVTWDTDDDGAWNIWFTAEGTCSRRDGRIVSGMMTSSDSDLFPHYYTDQAADMTVTVDGKSTAGTPLGDTFLFTGNRKNCKNFGYRLFYGPGDPSQLPESVTITLENLMVFETYRMMENSVPVHENGRKQAIPLKISSESG